MDNPKPLNRIKVMLAERMVTNKEQPSLENLIEIARCLKCEINDLVRVSPTEGK